MNDMRQRGDLVPHFQVTTLDGRRFSYSTIWQRTNLVLVAFPESDSAASRAYAAELALRIPEFRLQNTVCVMTGEQVPGLLQAGTVVADQWGEIVDIRGAATAADLMSAEELLEWVRYVEIRCPECEGEAT
jgi:hypothetical protein